VTSNSNELNVSTLVAALRLDHRKTGFSVQHIADGNHREIAGLFNFNAAGGSSAKLTELSSSPMDTGRSGQRGDVLVNFDAVA